MTYRVAGVEREYTACPLKIVFYDGFWYLAALNDKKEIRTFRLDNIGTLSVLEKGFVVPPDVEQMLRESVNVWFSLERTLTVTLSVAPAVAQYFKQRSYFPLQRIIAENKDGALMIETRISKDMEILPTIFQWMPHITVKKPAALRKKIQAIVHQYSGCA
jgi:predicted DNA-binding transcriptional regulator YafY